MATSPDSKPSWLLCFSLCFCFVLGRFRSGGVGPPHLILNLPCLFVCLFVLLLFIFLYFVLFLLFCFVLVGWVVSVVLVSACERNRCFPCNYVFLVSC